MSQPSKKKQGPTKPMKGGKPSGDAQTSRRAFRGLIPELPVLYPPSAKEYDELQHNVQEVLDRLTTYLTSKYGQAGTFLSTGSYYVEKDPTPPVNAYDETDQASVIEWALHKATMIEVMKQNRQYLAERPNWYGIMMGQLSQASKDLIEAHADYAAVSAARDPLLMKDIWVKTHQGAQSGSKGMDRRRALSAYVNMVQGNKETLSAYRQRLTQAHTLLKLLQPTNHPTDEDVILQFVEGMRGRYTSYAHHVLNDYMEGLDTPTSLAEAQRAAEHWRTDSHSGAKSHTDLPHTAYVAHSKGGTDEDETSTVKMTKKSKSKPSKAPSESKGEKTADSSAKKKQVECLVCGGDHWANKCPFRDRCQQLIKEGKIVAVTLRVPTLAGDTLAMAASKEGHLGPYDVLLDNQANANVFHQKELLHALHEVKEVYIGGITDGPQMSSTTAGSIVGTDLGQVMYFEQASANVLSFSLMASRYPIQWDQDACQFILFATGGQKFVFRERRGLYICDFSFLLNTEAPDADMMLTSASDNEKLFSRREVTKARLARTLLRRLGYTPPSVIGKMLNQGAMIECPVTSQDLTTADKIYGQLVPELRGKTVRHSGNDVLTMEPGATPPQLDTTMYTDIMFVNRSPFLLSVLMPINLTIVSDLRGSRAIPHIRSALDLQLNSIEEAGTIHVREMHCDNEFDADEIRVSVVTRGVKTTICGPGQHVPVIERKIRVVKERVRAHLSVLPYKLPASLLPWLLYFVVFCLNCVPTSTAGFVVSPRELMTGRKLNYKRDLRFEFGEYIEARNPNVVSNSMEARTNAMIPLLSTGNQQGSVHCYNIATKRVVPRDHWTVLPIPDIVIASLNSIADCEDERDQVGTNPEFRIGDTIVASEEPAQAEVEVDPAIPEDTSDPAILDDASDQLQHEDTIDPPEQLTIRIPKDIWNQGVQRGTTELDLQDGVLRDADGDVIMDTQDSVNYFCNGMPEVYPIGRQPAAGLQARQIFRLSTKQATKLYGEEKTSEVLRNELQQMLLKDVWEPVCWDYLTEAERKSVIRSSIFLKEKFTASGVFDKLRARLVAGGHMQDKTIYSDVEIASPTVSTSSIFLIAAIAAKEGRQVACMDFSGAYLNASMKKRVLMSLDPTLSSVLCTMSPRYKVFLRKNGTIAVKLKKALYGCVESAKLWYELISEKLIGLGFTRNDPCVYNKLIHGSQLTLCLYVDDLLMTCADEEALNDVIIDIDALFLGTTLHRGKAHSYIGMMFDFNTAGCVSIRMDGYTEDFLREYEVTGTAATPAKTDLFEIDATAQQLDDAGREEFHSRVAKLLYLAKRTRPDLLTAVSFLSTRIQAPTTQDLDKLQRLLRYIHGTKDIWLTLEPDDQWALFAHIDAAYGVHADAKGHTGVCMLLGKGAFYVASVKQKLVAKSSTEAEIIGVSDGLSEVIWARNFILAQGITVGPAIVFQDNQSTMAMIEKGRSTSSRTRHIHIRYFFVKDRVESGDVIIRYLPTEDMIADILTKPLQGELFRKLRGRLLNAHV